MRPNLDFRLGGYGRVRCDRREEVGGGCVTFIREDILFSKIGIGNEHKYIVIGILMKEGELIILNYYNPCKKLDLNGLMQIEGMDGNKRVICGDFNAHSTLSGGTKTDVSGGVIEQLLEEKDLVCLNDGRRTRLDVHTGNMSVLDLTLVSNNLAGICEWDVTYETSVGSDHHLVFFVEY